MAEFLHDFPNDGPPVITSPPASGSQRRPLRILLLGSKQDVSDTIKNLHQRGFVPAGEWSKPIACPNSGELINGMLPNLPPDSVVSIVTKYLN